MRLTTIVVLALLLLTACAPNTTDDPTPAPSPTASSPSDAPTATPTDGPASTEPASPTPATRTVEVFFTRDGVGDPCEDVVGVAREVPAAAPLRGALGQTVVTVTDRVMASLQPGAIVLMHVGSHPTDGSTLDADALPGLIDRIRAAGYTFVDLDAVSPS